MLPTWSVMIPTYRCNDVLVTCLESVLRQDLGPERMQIAVVNDDPADTACESAVAKVGGGRVAYHCNERNLGAGGNFNRCLELADRDLVLILHGDNYLKPGFFERLSQLAIENPQAGVIACRADGVDDEGNFKWTSERYPTFESFTRDDSPIWTSLHLMPSAVVVRRETYRRIGGFREDIANGQDWEMWARAIRAEGIIMTPESLAAYRQHAASITGRTGRTAQNIREFAQLFELLAANRPGYPLAEMKRELSRLAYRQTSEFKRRGDQEAARANYKMWCELTPFPARVATYAKFIFRKLTRPA